MDEVAKRRVKWAERVVKWSHGKLILIDVTAPKDGELRTDTAKKFDGLLVAARVDKDDGTYSVSIIPTFQNHDTSYGISAEISLEDGEYRYIGSSVADNDDPKPKRLRIDSDALGEYDQEKKQWHRFPMKDRGHRIAAEKFDSYLALLGTRLGDETDRSR